MSKSVYTNSVTTAASRSGCNPRSLPNLKARTGSRGPGRQAIWPGRHLSVKIQFAKVLIFALLLGGFLEFGGFERPRLAQNDYRSNTRFGRAWIVTVTLFVVGAVLTVWGNEIAEMVELDIPRGLYPISGVLLLLAGFLWMLMLRDASKPSVGLLVFSGRVAQL